jgi:nitrate reductase gamma subunit
LLLRRVAKPEVRILTTGWDYFLILLTIAPYLTGFLAKHQAGDYETMLTLHILLSEILLIVIPFSKLGHMVLFFATRFVIGSEMGGRRNIEDREGARVW